MDEESTDYTMRVALIEQMTGAMAKEVMCISPAAREALDINVQCTFGTVRYDDKNIPQYSLTDHPIIESIKGPYYIPATRESCRATIDLDSKTLCKIEGVQYTMLELLKQHMLRLFFITHLRVIGTLRDTHLNLRNSALKELDLSDMKFVKSSMTIKYTVRVVHAPKELPIETHGYPHVWQSDSGSPWGI